MNYANYDLQTQPVNPKREIENPTNPEEIPTLEYPSREEPGHFYANEAERVEREVNDSDEELVREAEARVGVESAGDNNRSVYFDEGEATYAQVDGPLAAHSGDGLRH